MPASPARAAFLTNIQSEVDETGPGPGFSLVTVQSAQYPAYRLEPGDPWRPSLAVEGTTRIPDSYLPVHDGLLHGIRLARGQGIVRLELDLAHPAGLAIRRQAGPPHLLCLALDRRPLHRIMHARRIHLKPEGGFREPANPPAKDGLLDPALPLADRLSGLGCLVTIDGRGELAAARPAGLAAGAGRRAEAIVALRASWHPDRSVRGIKLLWHTEPGLPLARRIHQALEGRLGMPDRGIAPGLPWEIWTGAPAVTVEFAALSNPLERYWLRCRAYMASLAAGIAHGLGAYFFAAVHSPSRPESRGIWAGAAKDADDCVRR